MASTHDDQYCEPVTIEKLLSDSSNRGFECEFIHLPASESIQLECPVCLLIIREPHQVTCCGKRFCHSCIMYMKSSERPCPNCGNQEMESFPDKGLKEKLYLTKICCSHKQEGCEWTGELGQLDEHLNTDPQPEKQLDGCQFVEIECLYRCGTAWQRQYLETHQRQDCSKRPFNCEHCHNYDSTFEDVVDVHWSVCGSFPVYCPNECGLKLVRKRADSHVADECPLTTISCDFHHVGCAVKLPRKDMPDHLKDNLLTHISLLAISHGKQQDEITVQKAEIAEQKAQIDQLVQQNISLQIANENVQYSNQSLLASFNRMQSQMSKESQTLRDENTQLKRELTMLSRERKPKPLINPTPHTTIPVRVPMLALTNFSQRKKNIEMWYSPPVYTSAQGYKLCLGVYTNIPNKYISVFIYFMRGEFDDALRWPFCGIVWFRLVDQLKNESHKEYSAVYDERVSEEVCGRVRGKERADKGWGKATFIAHSQLEPQFLHANTLHFQIFKVQFNQ